MFRGRKQLGNEIRIGVQTAPATRTPTTPDAAPTFRVYTETGTNVVNGSLPPTERYTSTGLFEFLLPLNSSFAAGRHWVRYDWLISGTHYAGLDSFEVILGGNSSGCFVSLFFLDRPDADWILGQTDMGTTSINRAPRL